MLISVNCILLSCITYIMSALDVPNTCAQTYFSQFLKQNLKTLKRITWYMYLCPVKISSAFKACFKHRSFCLCKHSLCQLSKKQIHNRKTHTVHFGKKNRKCTNRLMHRTDARRVEWLPNNHNMKQLELPILFICEASSHV